MSPRRASGASRTPSSSLLWAAYASYVPVVMFQYWSLWDAQQTARNATAMSVEAGRLDWSAVRQAPDGIFVDTNQRFAVNGVEFLYAHRSLRFADFLVPQADLVALPLFQRAQVRVTYLRRGRGPAAAEVRDRHQRARRARLADAGNRRTLELAFPRTFRGRHGTPWRLFCDLLFSS